MLVLSRKAGERLYVGDNIVVTVIAVESGRIRLGIEAPNDVRIRREELLFERPPPAPLMGRRLVAR